MRSALGVRCSFIYSRGGFAEMEMEVEMEMELTLIKAAEV